MEILGGETELRVTIYRKQKTGQNAGQTRVAETISGQTAGQTKVTEENKLLAVLVNNSEISVREIAEQLGLSKSAVSRLM